MEFQSYITIMVIFIRKTLLKTTNIMEFLRHIIKMVPLTLKFYIYRIKSMELKGDTTKTVVKLNGKLHM